METQQRLITSEGVNPKKVNTIKFDRVYDAVIRWCEAADTLRALNRDDLPEQTAELRGLVTRY